MKSDDKMRKSMSLKGRVAAIYFIEIFNFISNASIKVRIGGVVLRYYFTFDKQPVNMKSKYQQDKCIKE